MESVYHSHGRVIKSGSSFKYEYHITDHLGNVRVTFEDANGDGYAERKSLNDYYSFGMEWNNRWELNDTIIPENRYRYNGKEYVEEMGWNNLMYGARNMMPDIGRFSSIDPLAGKYLSLSPFAYVANNPINFIDPDGMQIGDGKNIFNKFKGEVNAIINSYNKSATKFLSKADQARAEGNDKKAAKYDKKANSASASAATYSEVMTELNALEASDQVYNMYINSGDVSVHAGGSTSYNITSGSIDVKLKDGYNSNFLSHELKHSFQFEMGQLSFKSDGGIGDLYDLMDEIDAYKRGRMFGETRNPSLSNLAKDYPMIKNNTTQRSLYSKHQYSDKTYLEIFKMRALAQGGKGIQAHDIYKN